MTRRTHLRALSSSITAAQLAGAQGTSAAKPPAGAAFDLSSFGVKRTVRPMTRRPCRCSVARPDGSGTLVRGLMIFYPERIPTDVHPYPWTFHLQGIDGTVENLTIVNTYNGIRAGPATNGPHRLA